MSNSGSKNKRVLTTREMSVFAMLGAVMFIGDFVFEWAMNVHPLTMLLIAYTVVYRKKGIIPFVVYLLLQAAVSFGLWIVPYCYIFPLCWLCTLAVPEGMSEKKRQVCYTVICTAFGLFFGVLYAPWNAVIRGFNMQATVSWIIAGLPADAIHALGNFVASFLIFPIVKLIKRIEK